MKNLTKEQQFIFYNKEIEIIREEYNSYLSSKCIDLINKNELFVGLFEYIDESRNQVVFSFPKDKLSKTRIPLTASKAKSSAIIASDFVQCDKVLGYHFDTFGYIEINHEEAKRKFFDKGKDLMLLEIGASIEL